MSRLTTRVRLSPGASVLLGVLLTIIPAPQYPVRAQQSIPVNLRSVPFVPSRGIPTDTIEAIRSNLSTIMADPLLARVGKVHVLIQMERLPSRFDKEDAKRYGVEFLSYIPPNTWVAAISGDAAEVVSRLQPLGVRWIGMLTPEIKQSRAIREDDFEEYCLMPDDRAIVLVQFHRTVPLDIAREIVARNGAVVNDEVRTINSLVITIPKADINTLASEDGVLWVEQAPAGMDVTNNGIRAATNVNAIQAAPYNLDGSGVTVMVFDGGLVDDVHPDFGARVTHGEASCNWKGTAVGVEDHPTHVAGTLAGDGAQSQPLGIPAGHWRGMAPAVDVVSYGVDWNGTNTFLYDNVGDLEQDFDQAINDHGADIATASVITNVSFNGYNCNMEGNYNATSQLIDGIVRGSLGRPIITTWCAGNERGGNANCGNAHNTIAPPACAKNPIHVGAVNSDDNTMTTFSGWGPTDDGRLKPVIVAPGDQVGGDGAITSTIPDLFINHRGNVDCAPGVPGPGPNTDGDDFCFPYDRMVGTSMATPAVAGIAALMLEQYRDTYQTDESPLPSTIKAILMHTAQDLGNPGPDFQFGYGLVDAEAAVDLIRNAQQVIVESQINEDDEVDVFEIQVPQGQAEFDVSLAWDDAPGAMLAATELQNDLDLTLEAPVTGTIHEPWVLDHTAGNEANNATTGVDDRNNMEQVHVANPAAGTWKIRVTGEDVPEPIQKYSLVSDFPLYLANNVSVVQVIDRTGSMSHRDDPSYPTYMQSARTAAQNFIGLMQIGDEIGVVSFDDPDCDYVNGQAEARFNLAEITNETVRGNAISSVNGLTARGCTSIGAGMELAQNGPGFLDGAASDNPHAMVLLSDGFENTTPLVSTVMPIIPTDTDIYTIALGPYADDALMKEVASTTGGKYYESPTILGLLSIYFQIQGDLELGSMADLGVGTKSSGNATRRVIIDQGASEATFVVGWLQGAGNLELTLADPQGNPVTPTSPNVTAGSGSTYSFLALRNPLPGEWEVHLTRTDAASGAVDYTFAAFVKDVSKTWSFVPTVEEAGNCLLVKVHLFDSRTLQPITGASVNAVVSSPRKYKYTLHYDYVAPKAPQWRPEKTLAHRLMHAVGTAGRSATETLPTWASTLERHNLESIEQTGESVFQYDTFTVPLYDDGTDHDEQAADGIYTCCIDRTRIAGSYNIRFEISGVTSAGMKFERRILSTARLNPSSADPASVLVRVDPPVIDMKEGSQGMVTVVPKDRFGNVWGPGHASRISVSSTAGQLSGDLLDNGDGFYFQKIVSTGTEEAGVISVSIDGVDIDTKPTVTFGQVLKRYSISLHSGSAMPAAALADDYDPGFNVLLDAGYRIRPNLSLVALAGHNDFRAKSSAGEDNPIVNLSLNARFHQQLNGPVWYYLGGGPGVYIPDVGDTKAGANVGLGLDYALTPSLGLELGADYHAVFDTDVEFTHAHAGVVLSF